MAIGVDFGVDKENGGRREPSSPPAMPAGAKGRSMKFRFDRTVGVFSHAPQASVISEAGAIQSMGGNVFAGASQARNLDRGYPPRDK